MHVPRLGPLLVLPLAAARPSWKHIAFLVAATAVFLLVALHVLALRRGRRRRQHITKHGAVFFLVTLAVGIVALHTKINFLVLIFGMMLSASVLSILLSRTAMRQLRFERRVPSGICPAEPFTIELEVSNDKRLLSSYGLAVHDDLPEGLAAPYPGGVIVQLRAGQSAGLPYTARARQRGVYPLRSVSFSTRFPFGFFHQQRSCPLAGELVVYPRLGTVASDLLGRAQSLAQTRRKSQSVRGHEEFRSLREYRLGDNPRWIHWKSSARLGQPLVKEYEAVVSERAFILLDTRAPANGTEPLESAVSFVATLARDLMLRGFSVSLAAYAPDLVVTAAVKGSAGLHALLELLARLDPSPQRTLTDLVNEPQVRAENRTLVVAALLRNDADATTALERLQSRHPRVLPINASLPSFGDIFRP